MTKIKTMAREIMNASLQLIPEQSFQHFDQSLHAWQSHLFGWLSPAAASLAFSDWWLHLNSSPEKYLIISRNGIQNLANFISYTLLCSCGVDCPACVERRESDKRFENALWNEAPFKYFSQAFLLSEKWWDNITSDVRGVTRHHENLVNFLMRQMLDIFSPSNIPWMNPEIIQATYKKGGMNFIKGYSNLVEDIQRYVKNEPPVGTENFQVGKDVAITPGKVVYRNELIELIRYEPATTKVYAEPILIVPAWIMKYYILDLSPNNSMVKYLRDKGHTVFMISWKNPEAEDWNLGLNDYVNKGFISALNVVSQIIPQQKVHAVGYCIGGTLLMISAATMANKNDDRLKSITLFAAQVDFKEAGELLLFIDKSQLTYLEDIMWEKGYLDGSQMQGALSMLRSVDLIWSRVIFDYLLGERRVMNDLMAWDQDTTRLPYKMHSEYLRNLFLNNDLVNGHYTIDGTTISLMDIKLPIFSVSTIRDHVAPWKSVYKLHYFTETDITFVLTSGGHNSGVVNEPGRQGQSYQIMLHKREDKHLSPRVWQEKAPYQEGTWWPAWLSWLSKHSNKKIPVSEIATSGYKVFCNAPGTFVFQK